MIQSVSNNCSNLSIIKLEMCPKDMDASTWKTNMQIANAIFDVDGDG